jgi:hypothetical protein
MMMCFMSCLFFSRFGDPLQVVSVVLTRPSSSASSSFLTSKRGVSRICVEVMFGVSGSGLQNAEAESDQSQRHENRRSTSLNNANCIQVRGTKVHIIRRWVDPCPLWRHEVHMASCQDEQLCRFIYHKADVLFVGKRMFSEIILDVICIRLPPEMRSQGRPTKSFAWGHIAPGNPRTCIRCIPTSLSLMRFPRYIQHP